MSEFCLIINTDLFLFVFIFAEIFDIFIFSLFAYEIFVLLFEFFSFKLFKRHESFFKIYFDS